MGASDVIEGIREYTGQSGMYIDKIYETQLVVSDIVSFILGLLVFFLTVGMVLIIALDLCYITMPIFQELVNNKKWDGTNSSGKFRVISSQARQAVIRAHSEGTSALKLYLKSSIKKLFICGFILALSIGGWGDLVKFVSNIVVGILEAVQGIVIE